MQQYVVFQLIGTCQRCLSERIYIQCIHTKDEVLLSLKLVFLSVQSTTNLEVLQSTSNYLEVLNLVYMLLI